MNTSRTDKADTFSFIKDQRNKKTGLVKRSWLSLGFTDKHAPGHNGSLGRENYSSSKSNSATGSRRARSSTEEARTEGRMSYKPYQPLSPMNATGGRHVKRARYGALTHTPGLHLQPFGQGQHLTTPGGEESRNGLDSGFQMRDFQNFLSQNIL